VAYDRREGKKIVQKVFSDTFGYSKEISGGSDQRVFVLKYSAAEVSNKANTLI